MVGVLKKKSVKKKRGSPKNLHKVTLYLGDDKKSVVKKKKVSKKRVVPRKTVSHKSDFVTNKILVDNFIGLQKVMVDLAGKFDGLSVNISKLLDLFEASAKHLAKKDFETEKANGDSEKILEKLDALSEKAGLIGKGLALIHEANSGFVSNGDFSGMEKSRRIETNVVKRGMISPKSHNPDEPKEVKPVSQVPSESSSSEISPSPPMTKEIGE
ncbi:MAG: hypothetical protein KKC19_03915 [Nanoarchaeota archaeon]|nr:hypothetical protein [Nanoarchaeota archaeon]